jgi:pilus assembly protein Flp/PilA
MPAMRALAKIFAALADDRRGATAVEYGLIIGLVVMVLIVGLTSLASTTTGLWNNVSTKVQEAR